MLGVEKGEQAAEHYHNIGKSPENAGSSSALQKDADQSVVGEGIHSPSTSFKEKIDSLKQGPSDNFNGGGWGTKSTFQRTVKD